MAATSTSDVQSSAEGPVLTLINKRIRALRKKQNRIIQMEESLSQGKTLNKEQQEVLRSKPGVFALIDELEKLRSPLSAAVSEEVSLAIQSHQAQASSSAETVNGDADAAEEVEEAVPDVSAGEEDEGVLGDLLNLLYFGSLFDVMPQSDFTSMMLTRTHERGCCLTYDYVTDDATDLLGEKDLDLIASLKGLMISRPVASSLSHKNALQRCIEHAKLWLAKSDQPIDPQSNVTYVGLREKLSKILSSDYYTTTPEMRGPVEMAAAAGVASFGSFQVPVHGSVVPMPVQPQGSVEQHQEAKETDNYQEYETTAEQQPAPVEEELQKGNNPDAENTTQEVSIQASDHENTHSEEQQQQQQQRDIDSREQHQHAPRRPYQNQRGGGRGGRRGYPNGRGGRGGGRGGGPYQNGRGQYYDQGGSYYPRTNYRGRGGRGGGGNSYYSHSTGIPSQDEQ